MSNDLQTTELTPLEAIEDRPGLGPAMKALNSRQRMFVIALFEIPECSPTAAARLAGYIDNGGAGIRVQAGRLKNDARVQAAIIEYARTMEAVNLPQTIHAIRQIGRNEQHKDQLRALLSLKQIGGLHDVIEKNVNVNVTISAKEKLDWLKDRLLADGKDLAEELGSLTDVEVIDGDFEVIGDNDQWANEEY